jgi:TctA family transporter
LTTGGPRFLLEHKDIVYAIILATFVQGALLIGIGLIFCRYAEALVKVPL